MNRNQAHMISMTAGRVALVCMIFICSLSGMAQNISVNATGALPDSSAMLDVSDTTRGMLMPRLTTIQMNAISNPAAGLIIYNTTDSAFRYFDGNQWQLHIDTSKLPLSGGIMSGSIDMGANNITNAQYIVMNNGATLHYGNVNTAQQTTLVGSFGASDAGKTWYNSDSAQLALWDGTQVIYVTGGSGIVSDLNAVLDAGSDADNDSIINLAVLGIGTSTPSKVLHVQHSASDGITTDRTVNTIFSGHTWQTSGTENWFLGQKPTSNNMVLRANGTKNLVEIDTSGHIEILNTGNNIYIGSEAGENDDNTTDHFNIGIGHQSQQDVTTGVRNVGVGYQTLEDNTTGSDNVAIGHNALQANSEDDNTAVGSRTLQVNTTGTNNTAVGQEALTTNTIGDRNTAVGSSALANNDTGSYNVAVGSLSQFSTSNGGEYNTSVGTYTLEDNTTGDYNTAIGFDAMEDNTTGEQNTAVGSDALGSMTTGYRNTALGMRAGDENNGDYNVFVGHGAGENNTSGDKNVMVGYHAGQDFTGSNRLFIDNSDTTKPLLYGDFEDDTIKVYGALSVGDAFAFPTSDGISGQTLTTNGNGTLSWGSGGSGDSDWTVNGTDIYNQNTDQVGIGTGSTIQANTKFHVKNATTTNQNVARLENSYTGTSTSYNLYLDNNPSSGSGSKYGIYHDMSSTAGGSEYGMFNFMTGTRTSASARAGIWQNITHGASATGDLYGMRNNLTNPGTGNTYGTYYSLTNTGSTGDNYGLYVKFNSTGSGENYGVFTEGEEANSFEAKTGIGTQSPDALLHVDGNAVAATGGRYGISSTVTDGGNGSTTIYGIYSNPTSGGGGSNTYYGVYTDASVTSGSSNSIGLYSNGSQYSAIFEGGPVGLGTSDPLAPVQIDSFLSMDGSSAEGLRFYGYNVYHDGTDFRRMQDGVSGAFVGTDDYTGIFGWESGTSGGIVNGNPSHIFRMEDSVFVVKTSQDDTVMMVDGGFYAKTITVEDEFSLPTADGANGQVMQTDGSGNLTWVSVGGASTDTARVVADVDYDTKIQVEEANDEDIIRFDVEGSEVLRVHPNGRMHVSNAVAGLFIGSAAGSSNSSGSRNTFVGYEAGANNTTNSGNTFFGYRAGYLSNAASNTMVGAYSGDAVTSGSENTMIGMQSGSATNTGSDNVFVGKNAGRINSTGDENTFVGTGAGDINNGSGNVFIGNLAGSAQTTASDLLFIDNSNTNSPLIFGDFSSDSLVINGDLSIADEYTFPATDGTNGQIMQTDGNGVVTWETAGASILGDTTQIADADNDTKIQVEETTDEDIIRIDLEGTEYFNLDEGRINVVNTGQSVFLGDGAGANEDLTTRRNTLIGYEAGTAMTSADHTVSVGYRAGHSLNAADENVFIGSQAGQETVGNRNVMVGRSAGQNNTGTRNVFIGSSAGKNNDGNQNVFIGYHVGNSTANTVSNELHIDNSNVFSPLIWGDFTEDSLTIHGLLSVDSAKNGTSQYTFPGADGTANQIMKTNGNGVLQWVDQGPTDLWIPNGNDLYTNYDSVGIGTTDPEWLVDIRSDQNIMLHLSPVSNTGENSSMVIQGARNGGTTQDNANIFLRNYDNDLSDWNNIAKISAHVTNHSTNVGDLLFYNYADGSTKSETMRLTKDGDVAVNVASPIGDVHFNQDSLRVSAPNNFSGASMSIFGQRHNSGAAFATLDFRNYDSSDGATEYSGARIESTNSGNSDDGDLNFYTTNNQTSALAMTITADGEVGIGSTSMIGNAVLTVREDVNAYTGMYLRSGTTGRPFYGYSLNGALSGWTYVDGTDAGKWKVNLNSTDLLTMTTSGELGIGTNDPQAELHIRGTSLAQKFQSTSNLTSNGNNIGVIGFHDNQTTTNQASIVVERDGASSGAGDVGTSMKFNTTSDGSSTNTTRMIIEEDGDVGIGITAPTHILHINGQGRATSTLWAITSDERAKQNVHTISNATETLMKFRPVTYEWKPAFKEKYDDTRDYRYGFISQEVEQIIPDMTNEIVEIVGNDTIEDFKLLDQEPLIPLLVKTVQEQQLEIERLNESIESKNSEIDEMKAMMHEFMRMQGVDPNQVEHTVNQVAKKK